MSESYQRGEGYRLHRLRLFTGLLAIAVTATVAQAGVIFESPRVSVFGSNYGAVTVDGSAFAAGAAQGGGTWLSLSGSGSTTSKFEFDSPGPGDGPLVQWFGSGSGTFGSSTMPVSWDFTATSPANLIVRWELTFTINPVQEECEKGCPTPTETTFSGTTASGGGLVVNPGAFINTPLGETLTGYQISLSTTFLADAIGEVLSVNIPARDSIDINPAGAAVPEPGAFVLAGTGALVLIAARRRRRRQ